MAQWWIILLQPGRHRFDPQVGKMPWRRERQTTPVFLPGKSHGQRSLAGYSPRGHEESDMTEWLSKQARKYVIKWKILNGKIILDGLGDPVEPQGPLYNEQERGRGREGVVVAGADGEGVCKMLWSLLWRWGQRSWTRDAYNLWPRERQAPWGGTSHPIPSLQLCDAHSDNYERVREPSCQGVTPYTGRDDNCVVLQAARTV